MTRLPLIVIALGLLIWFALTARRLWFQARSRKAARGEWFSRIGAEMSDTTRSITDSGYPRLKGHWSGHGFDLQAIPDSLSYRKLPTLWLMVTLTDSIPLKGETRIMARASGLEAFSTFANLPVEVNLPPAFPPHCTLRATAPDVLPPLPVMDAAAALMADQKVKELVLSPKGIRIVYLAEEGARSAYLIHRDAEFSADPLPPALPLRLMQAVLDLKKVIDA